MPPVTAALQRLHSRQQLVHITLLKFHQLRLLSQAVQLTPATHKIHQQTACVFPDRYAARKDNRTIAAVSHHEPVFFYPAKPCQQRFVAIMMKQLLCAQVG